MLDHSSLTFKFAFMKTLAIPVILFSILFFATGCEQAPTVDEAAVKETITQRNQAFMEAFANKDAEALAALYTENGQLLPPNAGIVEGRSNIQEFWSTVMDMGLERVQLRSVEVHAYPGEAWEVGESTLYTPKNTVADQSKYVVGWKEVNGQWFLHRDIWNSSLPIPNSPAEETAEEGAMEAKKEK